MAKIQQVYSNGIYHGLPIIDDRHTRLSAIVVGASGISGQSQIDVLLQSPKRFKHIYALSRRAPQLDKDATAVQHVAVDLLDDPGNTAKKMKDGGVQADVVFFFGYVQLSAKERDYSAASSEAANKLTEVNGRLLQNFLTALDLVSIKPKRFLLQTGLKNYGVQLGPTNVPNDETAPRVTIGLDIFYYRQEDILWEYCRTHPETSWNVTIPSWIVNAVKASDMTTIYPLAVYAAVQKKRGKPLEFPGDTAAWEKIMPMSSAILDGLFHEWLVLNDDAKNEKFNIVDDSEFTWMRAWPQIAKWHGGMEWRPPQDETTAAYKVVEMPLIPRGYGPRGRCTSTFSLPEWAKREDTRQAWSELKKEHGLESDPFDGSDGMWHSLQFSLTMSWSWATSMDKARKFGWNGHVDSLDALKDTCDKFVQYKMTPPLS